jgi:sugar phosphate isomerase/epimerase
MKVGIRTTGTVQQLPFDQVCAWLQANDFDTIDVGSVTPDMVKSAEAHGVEIGQVDLNAGADLLNDDPALQKAAVSAATESIQVAADNGVNNMFYVAPAPSDPSQGRAASLEQWKRTMPAICEYAESVGSVIALEGWPGGSTHLERIGATPELLRAMFDACPSEAFGINFDPSHLIRLGVDYLRFLREFGHRAKHVHAKDTVLDAEALYLHGRMTPSLTESVGFGENWWRYCVPGEGEADWARIIKILEGFGFDGILSVEHEDARYWGDWEAQQVGFIRARAHVKRYMK